MQKPEFRHSAQQHLMAAKALLSETGPSAARYACLELRMAIESMTYLNLEAYLTEVSNDAMKHWQPKKVIDELLAIDPRADKSSRLTFARQDSSGAAMNGQVVGEDKRFTGDWANKAHNALGSFLHEPTIKDFEKGRDNSEEVIRSKVAEIIAELEPVIASKLWNTNFGEFIELLCECGFTVRRKVDVLNTQPEISCANCRKRWAYLPSSPTGPHRFNVVRSSYICDACNTEGFVDSHLLETLPVIVCDCGAKSKVEVEYVLREISRPSG